MAFNPQFSMRENMTGLTDVMKWSDDLSGNTYFPLTILAAWFIVFMVASVRYQNSIKGFALSALFSLSHVTAYVALRWVPNYYIVFPILLVGIAGLLIWVKGTG